MDCLARLGPKLFRTKNSFHFESKAPKIVFTKNKFLVRIFLRNRPLTIFRAKRSVWRVWGQNCCIRKLRSILSRKSPKSFFWKTRFRPKFFYETAPHLFFRPNGLYGTIGGNIVEERSFVLPKTHVFCPNFFTKRPPHLFWEPNELYGAFRGKTVSDENFAPFCLRSPRNRFSEKHVFGLNFFTKPHLT